MCLLQEPENTEIYGRIKTKSEFLIANNKECIVLIVWEDDINKISVGESYNFRNVSTRKYKELSTRIYEAKLKLTTTPMSAFTPIPPLQSLKESEKVGQIVAACVAIAKKCGTCFNIIAESSLGEHITKCSICSWTQRNELLVDDIQTGITFQTENSKIKLTIFKGQLIKFLTINTNTNLLQSSEKIEYFLLSLPEVKLQHVNQIVTNIEAN